MLGDDLVIGDPKVAAAYLSILKRLGVGVNLTKSILSPKGTCLEFAKRTIYKGMDVSPITLKDIASARSLVPALVQFMKTHNLTLPALLGGLGFGWRNLSWLSKPLGKLPSQIRTIILAINMPTADAGIEEFFSLGTPIIKKYVPNLYGVMVSFIHNELRKARLSMEAKLEKVKSLRFVTSEMKRPWYYERLISAWCTDLSVAENAVIKDRALNRAKSKNDINSILQIEATSLPVKDLTGYTDFFYEVWYRVISQAFTDYQYAVQDILKLFPKEWAHRGGTPALWVPYFMEQGFFGLYGSYLNWLRDSAKLGEHIFSMSKPEGLEGFSRSINAVTPIQIRFYRRWSGLLQGSINLNGLYLKDKKRALALEQRLALRNRNKTPAP